MTLENIVIIILSLVIWHLDRDSQIGLGWSGLGPG